MATEALTPPANTAELMEYIDKVRVMENETVFLMADRLREISRYMLFLADYIAFTAIEIKQNSSTFQWYAKMASVFEEQRLIVEQKTLEYQEALRVSKACSLSNISSVFNLPKFCFESG